ncbi:hypothetical protein A6A06_13110 [Streptomyces sp. CB02923]|uniref:hypothetical protein n=1 Tax=Streptomyces sp. CB02923 TaxID=1718985 RepID=UPI000939F09A|nr:hypothetical protein [Streptomyces sp. CB02923]OKI02039.1 hypothetical protein A6A06_13110 [Streptomyces sp. CB02923]
MTQPTTKILVLCGAAGVGKSTTAYEVSHQLGRADVPHALLDTDQLDQVHPWPPSGLGPSELSRRNLAALWTNLAGVGHTRLILTGVFVALAEELAWIVDAVPGADVTSVRLTADVPTLEHRVRRREIGSGAADQLARTLRQHEALGHPEPPGTTVIDTTGRAVTSVASEVVGVWLGGGGR